MAGRHLGCTKNGSMSKGTESGRERDAAVTGAGIAGAGSAGGCGRGSTCDGSGAAHDPESAISALAS
jgi:hypothetical protein